MSKIAKYMRETQGVLHSQKRHLKDFIDVCLKIRVAYKQPNPSLPFSASAAELDPSLLEDTDFLDFDVLKGCVGGTFSFSNGDDVPALSGEIREVDFHCVPTGHVYFIRATDSQGQSLVKIGHTGANPYQRFYTISKGLPGGHTAKIECCLMFAAFYRWIDGSRRERDQAHTSAERFFHRYFADFRVGGEWFDITFDQVCEGIEALRKTGERIVFV